MFKNQSIKKIVAAAMLIVFAFSITPTIVFHNWLADHADTVKNSAGDSREQLGKITFNCHCDNIVAESPFTDLSDVIHFAAELLFSPDKTDKPVQFSSYPHHFCLLRGPPVV